MRMTSEQIKTEIASGGITAISLDTSIFEKSHNRFEHAPLSQLKQFRSSKFKFLLSDVVVGEVRAHVIRDANSSAGEVQASLRKIGEKWQTSVDVRKSAMASLFGGESPEQMFDRRFGQFKQDVGLDVVESEPLVRVSRVLSDYFLAKPPFGTNEVKKSEFPDAIALHALEAYAHRQKTKLLVIAKDKDWTKFCDESPVLVIMDELSDALSLFHQAEVVISRCTEISLLITDEKLVIDSEVESALQRAAEYLNLVPEANAAYYYDPDVEMVEVEAFELLPIQQTGNVLLKPVDHEDEYLVAEALARVTLAVTTSFSFSVTDSVDRDEVPMGSASVTESIDVIAKVFLTFEGDFSAVPELTQVEVEFERSRYEVDYGEVGPDWQDYEE